MAIDGKYGRVVTARGDIGKDEPVVVFRAQDKLLPHLLRVYRQLCLDAGSPELHLRAIDDTLANVEGWQSTNYTQVPQSKGYEPMKDE
jgi:hypothetical protein